MKTDPYLSLCSQIGSKWVKDLNGRSETVNEKENTSRHKHRQAISEKDFNSSGNNMDNWEMWLYKSIKGTITYKMGENLY